LNILKDFRVLSRFLQKSIQSPACSDHGLNGTNRDLFRQTVLQKCGRVNTCSLEYGSFVSRLFEEYQHPAIQTKIVQHFGGFFHQIKVRQPIGRKDSIQTVI
jgi:hypothetical protein